MRLIRVNKPYSWLQWPVVLEGAPSHDLHITAKFFGNAYIDPGAVERMLPEQPYYPVNFFMWEPTVFGDLFHVLELKMIPPTMIVTHQRFDLIQDQFQPWRPHITVPLDYWTRVKEMKLEAKNEIQGIGEIELYLGTGGE